jgi:hypothetical protein
MKNVYLVIFALCACLTTFVPQRSFSQCLCSGGIAPTAVTYLDTVTANNAPSSTITFPKFDPSIGTLGCVGFDDTISDITTTTAWNISSSAQLFEYLILVTHHVNGPGVSVNETGTKTYGPDSLQAVGTPGDSIVWGPDHFLDNKIDHSYTSNTAPYLGSSGTVSYTYTLSGGTVAILSVNAGLQVATNYWGTFRLTYYWCPAGLLANLMSNFTAAKNGNNVQLKWQAQNEQKGILYEIEYSTDGSQYFPAGSLQSDSSVDGSAANYQFLYNITQNNNGKLYFRIKRTGADGKDPIYSVIKTVNLSTSGLASYRTYPNPVRSYTMLEFDEVLSGDFIIDLISTTGQIVQHKEVTLSGSNQVRLDLTSHPATGIYYLQVKDRTNNHQYISKLIIE